MTESPKHWNSKDVRQAFLNFFRERDHRILPSAPMVIKNDPSLMFTNAGMNQFKDIFLGNRQEEFPRLANTQKCLRVSGKHNDLEEVGHDGSHHTMFEMLGNWSFGDYFKEEAVKLAWELLTGTFKIDPGRIYVTYFKGNQADNLGPDDETRKCWKNQPDLKNIQEGSKKDNFWEMGETGPCGPCSEIHVDLRTEAERLQEDGSRLVNTGHPRVLEIWNLVFIQYNRKEDGSLEPLPRKHVDTGMGFERLCMVLQNKSSNYDTDLFRPLIRKIERTWNLEYGKEAEKDTAMRVVADHLRALAFAIADGQLPSNTGAGYVIRRILRRAVRYGYTFLEIQEPFMHNLVPVLVETMGDAYPELKNQEKSIARVIDEEQRSFLWTLDKGIRKLDEMIANARSKGNKSIDGRSAFTLYDTYGFPFDLTRLILKEKGMHVSEDEFAAGMKEQQHRSRKDAEVTTGDWTAMDGKKKPEFTGYDVLSDRVKILRYRTVEKGGKKQYQVVLDKTPFYAEGGGQVGDSGILENNREKIRVLDTRREHELIVHDTDRLPDHPEEGFTATVDTRSRQDTQANHTATHLLHHALREVFGKGVEQKGSLVHPDYLRFDFSHQGKAGAEELRKIETLVNEMIRSNFPLAERRSVPMEEAMKSGALAFFGEKYGDRVRVIGFGDSRELCGGTHVKATGEIGLFLITKESAVAAGIRRIEAVTGRGALEHLHNREEQLRKIESLLRNQDPTAGVEKILAENDLMKKKLGVLEREDLERQKEILLKQQKQAGGVNLIAGRVVVTAPAQLKNLAFELKNQLADLFLVLGAEIGGKAHLSVMVPDTLIREAGIDANRIIREVSPLIKGGGGGQPFYATAGGSDVSGLDKAIEAAAGFLNND